jgi:predicted transcriptional regulator
MSDDERKRLDTALDRAIAQADAGRGIPAEQVIAEIRARRARQQVWDGMCSRPSK